MHTFTLFSCDFNIRGGTSLLVAYTLIIFMSTCVLTLFIMNCPSLNSSNVSRL